MARRKKEDSLVTINGETMTIEERNRRMKLDYVNSGLTLRAIGDKYGLSEPTMKKISSKEGWKDFKKAFISKTSQSIEEKLQDIYVTTGVEINLMYNNAWQEIMQLVISAVKHGEGIRNKHGELDFYRLNQVADILRKAQQGQQETSGWMPKEVLVNLQYRREELDLKKYLADYGIDDKVFDADNFEEMLKACASDVGILSEDSNSPNTVVESEEK